MKKQYFLIQAFTLFSIVCFSQTTNLGQGIPTFNGSNYNLSYEEKIQDIKDKTQLSISRKIGVDFVKKILKPGDSIEFSYQYVINVNGYPIPSKTKVNTQFDFFNNKIKRIINTLPKFSPAIAIKTQQPYPYHISFNSEFYVDKNHLLTPIYRNEILQRITISEENKKIKHKKNNVVYFTTDANLEITKIRSSAYQASTIDLLTREISKLATLCPSIYSQLEKNKNYAINVSIQKTSKNSLFKYEKADKFAVYDGCEKKQHNNDIKKCTLEKISNFVNKNFDTNLARRLGVSGRQKILITFTINTNGKISDILARAPHPALQKEAKRIVKKLPKFTPAIKDGKPIPSVYSLPIIYIVN